MRAPFLGHDPVNGFSHTNRRVIAMNEMKGLLTIEEATKYAGVAENHIRHATARRTLPCTKILGRVLIDPKDLLDWDATRIRRNRGR